MSEIKITIAVLFFMVILVNYSFLIRVFYAFSNDNSNIEGTTLPNEEYILPISWSFVDETHGLRNLWEGHVPQIDGDHNSKQNNNFNVHLVISQCKVKADWIWLDFIPQIKNANVSNENINVYSKCGMYGTTKHIGSRAPYEVNVVRMENVGRCDHSYAYHLCQWTSNIPGIGKSLFSLLNKDDVFIFMKDTYYRNSSWIKPDDVIRAAQRNGFACVQSDPYLTYKGFNPRFRGGYALSLYHQTDIVANFMFKEGHKRLERDKVERFPSNYSHMSDWVHKMGFTLPQPLMPICYGGVFAATVGQIRKQNPDTWCKMESSLSREDNIEESYFAERSWAALLMKSLSESAVRSLLNVSDGNVLDIGHFRTGNGDLRFQAGQLVSHKKQPWGSIKDGTLKDNGYVA